LNWSYLKGEVGRPFVTEERVNRTSILFGRPRCIPPGSYHFKSRILKSEFRGRETQVTNSSLRNKGEENRRRLNHLSHSTLKELGFSRIFFEGLRRGPGFMNRD
jgi:hypothetical protein